MMRSEIHETFSSAPPNLNVKLPRPQPGTIADRVAASHCHSATPPHTGIPHASHAMASITPAWITARAQIVNQRQLTQLSHSHSNHTVHGTVPHGHQPIHEINNANARIAHQPSSLS